MIPPMIGDLFLDATRKTWEAVAVDGDAALMARGKLRMWVPLAEVSCLPWRRALVCSVCGAEECSPTCAGELMRQALRSGDWGMLW